eukprot:1158710-Pelagomonas_calceolata.AAC.6
MAEIAITQQPLVAGQMWAAGCQKVNFTPLLIRHMSRDCLKTNSSARERPEEAKSQNKQLRDTHAKEHAKNT